jgi:hypothetical protein
MFEYLTTNDRADFHANVRDDDDDGGLDDQDDDGDETSPVS